MFIKIGDTVTVISGKELGKQGKVLRVFHDKKRVAVEHLNMIKRHTRPTQSNQQGGIVEREGTIHVSNLMIICGKCNRGVRIGKKILDDGSKVRICRVCGEQI